MKKRVYDTLNFTENYLNLQQLEELIDTVKTNDWHDFRIRIEYHGYDGADLTSDFTRMETDEEYNARIKKEKEESSKRAKELIKKREKDRALYEKLKAQFEET